MPEIENKVLAPDKEYEEAVAVAKFKTRKRAVEYGLVILSMNLPYWLDECADGGFELKVEKAYAQQVLSQLKKYDGERRRWKVPGLDLPEFHSVSFISIIFVGIFLVLVFTGSKSGANTLFQQGIMNATAIMKEGEWWRAITSLTLHNDVGHLAANVVFGGLFVYFLISLLGNGFGWLVTVLAGVAGNLLLAWGYYPKAHYSVGASTAIFGVIGALVGAELTRLVRERVGFRKTAVFIPLMAGLGVLGMYGTGDSNTDVLAHLWGFVAGIPLGLLTSFCLNKWPVTNRFQRIAGCLAAIIIATGWFFAAQAA